MQLNEGQQRAVALRQGPLQVYAGAGSGKTRVIIERIARLVEEDGVAPEGILAVTFTNRAAQEMRERAERRLGPAAQAIWFGTFHAICARLLRNFGESIGVDQRFVVYDDADQRAAVTRALRDLGIDDARASVKAHAARIQRAKQEARDPETVARETHERAFAAVYERYEQLLRASKALDFADLLLVTLRGLEQGGAFLQSVSSRFTQVLVDEFQDTNLVQYRLLRALCAGHRNLCVVGDDDQSIYRWRGAHRQNLADFHQDFSEAQRVVLDRNYRSTPQVLAVANAIIEKCHARDPKTLWTDTPDEQPPQLWRCADSRDETLALLKALRAARDEGFSYKDTAIFYRIHAQSRPFEETLRSENIPYRIIGGVRFYERAEVKDMLAYLRLVHNASDDVAFLRAVNTPARGIGKSTLEALFRSAATSDRTLLATAADPGPELSKVARRRLGAFAALVDGLQQSYEQASSVVALAGEVLERTGLRDALERSDELEALSRLENLRELLNSMAEWERQEQAEVRQDPLGEFLERVTLASEGDDASNQEDAVTLMTVHAAKGLEFPVVFIGGLEEGLFPYERATADGDPESLDEERRLAYVAVTRAERRLHLSYALTRRVYGQTRPCIPSRFLRDIESLGLETRDSVALEAQSASQAMWRRAEAPGWAEPEPQRASTESYIDYEDGDLSESLFRRGAQVHHARFGSGRILSLMPGSPPRARIAFDCGERQVLVRYLEHGAASY